MAKQVGCPTEFTLEAISGRWKVMVIYWLLKGERRFNQLQRDLAGITHRTLAKQLREMEASGLVERHDFREIPPRVAYRLTPLGRSLESVLLAMHDWAIRNGGGLQGPGPEEGPLEVLGSRSGRAPEPAGLPPRASSPTPALKDGGGARRKPSRTER